MSGGAMNNMSREKIQQLLKAIGSGPTEDTTQVEAVEYDWNKCHYFNNERLIKLNRFAETAAAAMTEQFSMFCRSEFNVTVASITQHYVNDFLGRLPNEQQKDFYIPFSSGRGQMCGLIGMPEQVAFNWARQLLGESEEEADTNRDLSQLEESLLLDLVSALIEVFSDIDKSFDFHSEKSIFKGQWPLGADGTEEICKISFNVKKTGSENSSEAYFLILCSELEPVTGKTGQDSGGFSEKEISKAILGHLREMPVLITGHLASTVLSFEEIMNLQVDDIVLLDKRVDQPAELIVDGRTVYYGYPAKSLGNYAVKITDATTAFGDTSENPNSNVEIK